MPFEGPARNHNARRNTTVNELFNWADEVLIKGSPFSVEKTGWGITAKVTKQFTTTGVSKIWVAAITGTNPQYGLQRHFLDPGSVSWDNYNSHSSTGQTVSNYGLSEGLHEVGVKAPGSNKATKEFHVVLGFGADASSHEVTESVAKLIAKELHKGADINAAVKTILPALAADKAKGSTAPPAPGAAKADLGFSATEMSNLNISYYSDANQKASDHVGTVKFAPDPGVSDWPGLVAKAIEARGWTKAHGVYTKGEGIAIVNEHAALFTLSENKNNVFVAHGNIDDIVSDIKAVAKVIETAKKTAAADASKAIISDKAAEWATEYEAEMAADGHEPYETWSAEAATAHYAENPPVGEKPKEPKEPKEPETTPSDEMPKNLKTGDKPPPGYTPIPGSKVGGWHKRKGNKWLYWYPEGVVPAAKKALASKNPYKDIRHTHNVPTKELKAATTGKGNPVLIDLAVSGHVKAAGSNPSGNFPKISDSEGNPIVNGGIYGHNSDPKRKIVVNFSAGGKVSLQLTDGGYSSGAPAVVNKATAQAILSQYRKLAVGAGSPTTWDSSTLAAINNDHTITDPDGHVWSGEEDVFAGKHDEDDTAFFSKPVPTVVRKLTKAAEKAKKAGDYKLAKKIEKVAGEYAAIAAQSTALAEQCKAMAMAEVTAAKAAGETGGFLGMGGDTNYWRAEERAFKKMSKEWNALREKEANWAVSNKHFTNELFLKGLSDDLGDADREVYFQGSDGARYTHDAVDEELGISAAYLEEVSAAYASLYEKARGTAWYDDSKGAPSWGNLKSDAERDAIAAVALLTAGNVSSVQFPELFYDESKTTKSVPYRGKGGVTEYVPSAWIRENKGYHRANKILLALTTRRPPPVKLNLNGAALGRGIEVSDAGRSRMKTGYAFHMNDTTQSFGIGGGYHKNTKITIKNPLQGLEVQHISFYASEKEVIMGGTLMIEKIGKDDYGAMELTARHMTEAEMAAFQVRKGGVDASELWTRRLLDYPDMPRLDTALLAEIFNASLYPDSPLAERASYEDTFGDKKNGSRRKP